MRLPQKEKLERNQGISCEQTVSVNVAAGDAAQNFLGRIIHGNSMRAIGKHQKICAAAQLAIAMTGKINWLHREFTGNEISH